MCTHVDLYLECIAQGGQRGNGSYGTAVTASNYLFNVILSLKVFIANFYLYSVSVWCCGSLRQVLDTFELELHMIVSHHMGAGNQTLVHRSSS